MALKRQKKKTYSRAVYIWQPLKSRVKIYNTTNLFIHKINV